MKHLSRTSWWSLLLLLPCIGCSAAGYAIEDLAGEINATLDRDTVRLAPGDVLSVTFPLSTERSHQTRVQTDGSAAFVQAGTVKVEGMTLSECQQKLEALYEEARIGTPFTVDLASGDGVTGNIAAVYVIGEVETPGPVELQRRRLTLLEAIGEAGGLLKESANPRNVTLVRRVVATGQMRSWRLDAHPDFWGRVPPIWLQPTDIIIVPNTAIDEVNIWIDKYIRQMLPVPYLIPPAS